MDRNYYCISVMTLCKVDFRNRVCTNLECPWKCFSNWKRKVQGLESPWIFEEMLEIPWIQ